MQFAERKMTIHRIISGYSTFPRRTKEEMQHLPLIKSISYKNDSWALSASLLVGRIAPRATYKMFWCSRNDSKLSGCKL